MAGRRQQLTDEERAERRELKRKEAEERLDMLLSEQGWATWLRLRRNLHEFSWTNQVLMAMQAWQRGMHPTIVKAAGRWKRDGYHPAKGSKALFIWVFKSRRRKDGTWRCCGQTYGPKQRSCQCGKSDHYFQLGPVFDAGDVRSFETGDPPVIELPTAQPVDGDEPGSLLLSPVAEWAVDTGLAASVTLTERSEHGEGGSWNLATRHLRVCLWRGEELVPDNRRLRTLIHELAHAKGITSKQASDGKPTRPEAKLTYADCEVAVECVSYIVASAVGLDTASEAIPYMAGWGGEDARDKVRQLAELIDRTAKELEEPILALLAERNREKVAA
jgi:hypothetical protein